MAEYNHGDMNTDVQENTFSGFIKMITIGAEISIGILIFLAIFNS